MGVLDKLKAIPVWDGAKHYGGIALVVALIFGGGYASGRYATPDRVVIQEKVQVVEKQVVVEKVVTDVRIVKVADTSLLKKLHREIVELKRADGSQEKRTTEDLNVDSVIHTKEQDTKIEYVDRIVNNEKTIVQEKLVLKESARPGWRLGGDLGVSVPYFLGQGSVGTPGMHGLVAGIHAERRVIGPLFIGLFGNTQGTTGLSLSGEF